VERGDAVIALKTGIRIERPLDEVFAYVSEPRNLPQWNSAVRSVRQISRDDAGALGSSYRMERELPTGKAVNTLEVVALKRPAEFAMRTTSGPTPFRYQFRFSSEGRATIVDVDTEAELGTPALLTPLARLAVRSGVDHNLAPLKAIVEDRR
jgi:uncharacterized protein YndB with AHSA1/START domain